MKLIVEIPKQDNDLLLRKKRSLRARASQPIEFDLALLDNNYQFVNLNSQFGFVNGESENDNYKLDAIAREGTMLINQLFPGSVVVTDTLSGVVTVTMQDTFMNGPGIYVISVAVTDKNTNTIALENEIFLYLERNIRDSTNSSQFPSLDEVRLSLRDSDPIENELLNWHDFSTTDICQAALRTVHQINAIPPPTPPVFTVTREIETDFWLDGITMFLFDMATEHYRRNRLPYQAGGVAIDDKAKEENYLRAWQLKYQIWVNKVQSRKVYWNARKVYTVVSTRGAVRGVGFTP